MMFDKAGASGRCSIATAFADRPHRAAASRCAGTANPASHARIAAFRAAFGAARFASAPRAMVPRPVAGVVGGRKSASLARAPLTRTIGPRSRWHGFEAWHLIEPVAASCMVKLNGVDRAATDPRGLDRGQYPVVDTGPRSLRFSPWRRSRSRSTDRGAKHRVGWGWSVGSGSAIGTPQRRARVASVIEPALFDRQP
jgi:hypothetical protein